jgi:hypothetical protein
MDFDASSYNRIIPSIASLASRSYGQHRHLCFIHGQFLRNAQFLLKTKLGLSTESYSHCAEYPIYGTGQGSMSSPTIWGLISTKLIETQEAAASGAVFKSQSVRICSVSFVDDTNAAVNVFPNEQVTPLEELIEKETADAQRWNDLLAATGGALEIPKCKFHLAFYHFSASGAPVLAPLVSQDPNHLPTNAIFPDPTAASPQNLEYLRLGQPRKTLGCYKCPSGNPSLDLQHCYKTLSIRAV